MIIVWLVTAWMAMESIGRPREPRTPAEAVYQVISFVLIIAAVQYLGRAGA